MHVDPRMLQKEREVQRCLFDLEMSKEAVCDLRSHFVSIITKKNGTERQH